MRMNILLLSPYPRMAGSTRLRLHQYLPFLQAQGHRVTVWSFFNEADYRALYQSGNWPRKGFAFLAGTWRCLFLLFEMRRYDVCVIHREVAPLGFGLFEFLTAKCARRLVYDFDDAVFEPNVSAANRLFAFLKSPRKIPVLLARSDAAIAGNSYLEDYAKNFARRTQQLPTPVDTQSFTPQPKAVAAPVVVGWIGSHSTAPYLALAREALQRLQLEMGEQLRLVFIGAGDFRMPDLKAEYRAWQLETELGDLRQLDIGIMPMPDNPWTRGKCGFKALLYMSVGLPIVCSPVGFNREIVTPETNGLWAETATQWYEALQRLTHDAELRQRMGAHGRKLVEKNFSVETCAPRFEAILRETVQSNK